jgi:hypothetical protein
VYIAGDRYNRMLFQIGCEIARTYAQFAYGDSITETFWSNSPRRSRQPYFGGFEDEYTFTGVSGQSVTITLDSNNPSEGQPPTAMAIGLYSPGYIIETYQDVSGIGTLTYTLTSSGLWIVGVISTVVDRGGQYTVSLDLNP